MTHRPRHLGLKLAATRLLAALRLLPTACCVLPTFSCLLPTILCTLPAAHAQEADLPAGLEVEDAAQPFVPDRPRSEEEEHRVTAVSLFAAGRVAEHEERLHQALRLYQRAARFDPTAVAARQQAVLLAARLGRWKDATRYAAEGELGVDDSRVLWDLANHLTAEQRTEAALRFYRQARSLQTEKQAPGYVVLSFDIGQLAMASGHFEESADAFAEVMEALEHPEQYGLDERLKKLIAGKAGTENLAETYLRFAEACLNAKRYDRAITAFDEAQRLVPDAPAHAYRLARVAAARGEPAQALKLLGEYLPAKQAGQLAGPYGLLDKVLTDLDRAEDLLPELQRLRAADPDNAPLRLFLADRLRASGMLAEAEPLYLEAVEKSPSPAAIYGLAIVERGLKRAPALLGLLTELVANTGGLASLGDEAQALAADGELLAAIVETARDKHRADPDSLPYGGRLAVALLALEAGRFDDADEFFNLALKVKREDAKGIFRVWGLGLLVKDKSEESVRVFERALADRAAPADDPTFHYFLGQALMYAGRKEEALDEARRAARMNPRSIALALQPAVMLYRDKQLPAAAEELRELVARLDEEEQSDEGRAELRRARLLLSNIAVEQHDYPTAEEWLEQVLDEFPDDVGAQNDLGYLWADQDKHPRMALAMVERAVSAEPANAAYRDSLGWALYKVGRYDDATVELKKAVELEKPDGLILEHLGDAAAAASETDTARDAFQRALADFEQKGDAEKIDRLKTKLARLAEKPAAPN
jgi:tetratricopeptide (TPR) repeat protein